MNLLVIRHGETALNKAERLQGSRGENVGLTDFGKSEVKRLRDELLLTPSVIYSSTLHRTQETAHIINERFGVRIVSTHDLVERDFGSLSGKLRSEIDPELLEKDLEGRYDYRPFGGESVADVRKRILHFLATLDIASDDTIFVVTHRGVIRVLYDLFPEFASGDEVIPASKHAFTITSLP